MRPHNRAKPRMQVIEGILLEPVGCLAEFPAEPFHEIATRIFGHKKQSSKSGSRSYWHLLNLMQAANRTLDESENRIAEELELQAVAGATVYEDVLPALAELKAMGIQLLIASSLSNAAITRFLEKSAAGQFFTGVWNRDNACGIKDAPIAKALQTAALPPEHVMFLTDTAEGLKVANGAGVNSILMMNDPDEAKRLAVRDPSGGIVSLHELPDFIRLVAAENNRFPGLTK
jgi:phosphoglycolate phosphatase-like HAD superfamily hydrolase